MSLYYLLHQGLGALVLYVAFGGGQQRAYRVDGDAAMNKSGARTAQLVQPVIIGRVHHPCALYAYALYIYIFFFHIPGKERENVSSESVAVRTQ